ncbi:hypothetical protein [Mycobacteroides abscessus]|uniref:hypothetical protein n=1 Tax=Mycobacteroides abscessus TaxID=36809 RepID=UPI0027E0F040|nr:hypothetical protein [Mycobacteroides abscessus]
MLYQSRLMVFRRCLFRSTQPGTDLYDRGFHEPTHEGANPRTPLGTNPHVPYGTNTTTVLQ